MTMERDFTTIPTAPDFHGEVYDAEIIEDLNVDPADIPSTEDYEERTVVTLSPEETKPDYTRPIPETVITDSTDREASIRQRLGAAKEKVLEVFVGTDKADKHLAKKIELLREEEDTRYERGSKRIDDIERAAYENVKMQVARMRTELDSRNEASTKHIGAVERLKKLVYNENQRGFANLQRLHSGYFDELEDLVLERDEAIGQDAKLSAEHADTKNKLADERAELVRCQESLDEFEADHDEILKKEVSLNSARRREYEKLKTAKDKELRKAMGLESAELEPLEELEKEIQEYFRKAFSEITSKELNEITGDILRNNADKAQNQQNLIDYRKLVKAAKTNIEDYEARLAVLPGLINEQKARFVDASEEIKKSMAAKGDDGILHAIAFENINLGHITERGTVILGYDPETGSAIEDKVPTILSRLAISVSRLSHALALTESDTITSEAVEPTLNIEELADILGVDAAQINIPDAEKLTGVKPNRSENEPSRKGFSRILGALGIKTANKDEVRYSRIPKESDQLQLTQGPEKN